MTTTGDRIRLLEQVERELTPQSPPACPDWCGEPAGHAYESTDYDFTRYSGRFEAAAARDLIAYRYHRRSFRGNSEMIDVTQAELAVVRPGVPPVVTLEEATVYTLCAFEDDMQVADARGIAQAFLDAAALVERING